MAEPTRQYIFNESQIRTMFIAASILSISVIVALLLLLSTRPQGQLEQPDRTIFLRTLSKATSTLHTTGAPEEALSNRIDIEQAMHLVATRGAAFPFTLTETAILTEDTSSDGGTTSPPENSAETQVPVATLDGGVVYNNCLGCHQANGAGIPGVFPSLVTHAPTLFNAQSSELSGRTYLIHLLLFGLQGEIAAGGITYKGIMPAWPQLSNTEIAAVLNHILSNWENSSLLNQFVPYTAEEIAEQRDLGLTPQDVYLERQELSLP